MFVINYNMMEVNESKRTFPAALRVSEDIITTIRSIGKKDRNRPDAAVVRIILEDFSAIYEKVIDRKGAMPPISITPEGPHKITFEHNPLIGRDLKIGVLNDNEGYIEVFINEQMASDMVANLITFINAPKQN